ncbi:CvfD/Ygs/GSP13 family RNA-binding post-transcriptional regulator [Fructobacillus fructosus]|jgi:general stress protein 13|uniref:Contains ribosomal protein S1 (RPS1) domain (YabR) n=1 Tax=Fructobacillus fructosus TaxID=1631 RepID=A0ABN9YRB2_9LACO|nr:CvfD/Ygs/GSP13 family RNA-binding post-transcriptional regulator [Fructobacillus fructosus]MBD9365839.1 S1 RNA-binding domain-containing protein [Leuconostoc mesenteroides]KRN51978.1 RNA-binding protein [Fructobacillus fructosus KCTC 3544]MBC9118933.1 S1 RNA-binding domain-containing protein [Fructobacillus fructosus]MCK8638511.1 CvfD/Ygs/GSP13 family RNA-binding post-transcriptional regulator [Fructobacillus fructosus]CAK1237078.1 Predicted RNA-binding protein [Fructobacillus fructosus]
MTYRIGQEVTGVVTGIQPYGAFVKLDEETQGLIHISELKSGIVKNLSDELSVGQKVTAIVLDIDQYTQKISLSVRQLALMSLVDTPIIKNNNVKRRFWTNYHLNFGFEPIALAMPGWIAEAVNRLDLNDSKKGSN